MPTIMLQNSTAASAAWAALEEQNRVEEQCSLEHAGASKTAIYGNTVNFVFLFPCGSRCLLLHVLLHRVPPLCPTIWAAANDCLEHARAAAVGAAAAAAGCGGWALAA